MSEADVLTAHLQRHQHRLAAAAWRVLRNNDQADDALQDALMRIWQERRHVLAHPNPPALMLRMVFQVAIDHWRRRRLAVHENHSSRAASAVHDDPRATLAADELRECLLQAIARLPGNQATALYLRASESLPYAEIAAAIGCDEATARVHVRRGRERLRRDLGHLFDGAFQHDSSSPCR